MESKKYGMMLFEVAFVVSIAIAGSGAAATELIVHNGESIQTAVDNSISGDTIIVEPGVYKEKISTHTNDLIIMSQSGNPDDTTIQGSGFTIWASNITIKGFTIKGADENSGIAVIYRTGKCRIENNKILNYVSGIEISTGSKLNVVNNNEISNCQDGITVSEGIKNTVSNNEILNCQNGITFREGSGNIINGNEVSNCQDGITYMEGFENIVSNNKISNCGTGINTGNGDATLIENRTRVEKNTITKNDVGISVNGCGGYTIVGNIISLNKKYGYEDYSTGTNLIYNNYFNNAANVNLGGYSRYGSPGIWNTTRTAGTNIIGGPYICGNYWATPTGNGFSQTRSDANGDGISEGHYSLNGVNIDYLPLVVPAQKLEPLLPIANFSTNTSIGPAPLSVQFTDSSQYATGRNWDFGDGNSSTEQNPAHTYYATRNYTANLTATNQNGTDSKLATITVLGQNASVIPMANFSTNTTQGPAPLSVQFTDLSQNKTSRIWDFNNDGITDSSEEAPVYVYTVPGNHTVNLTAINENGTASKLGTITVTEGSGNNSEDNESTDDETNGRSRSSSSGSSGVSREPAKNVEVKELAQAFIINGKAVKFDFTKNTTCVVYVSFDAKKTAGKTTAIVEMLKGKSALVPSLPSDKVYKSFNVWIGDGRFATSKNIENPVICFKVEKSWLQNNSIDQSSITLNRYNDSKWNQLSTSLSGEDVRYLYFTANVSEFSSFAIAGKEKSIQGENKTEMELEPDNRTSNEHDTENNGLETEQKEIKSTPGFEISYGVACLLVALMYKKSKSLR